jgi:pyridinium-3,5-biscarboxylic acid mononucleotide synthase
MTPNELERLLEAVRQAQTSTAEAQSRILQFLRQAPFEDLGFARVDHHRSIRQGFPEVVFGQGKTPEQVAGIAERIVARGHSLLVTRTTPEAFTAVRAALPDAVFHDTARAICLRQHDVPAGRGTLVVAAAGTSDLPIAEEAAVSAELMGNPVDRIYDVGVAGLHRLLAETPRLQTARVVIAVAGMEGAMPSVIAGLVAVPVIAVPTSVGYGASFGGVAALLGMLNSCSTGLAVVNIDNGFGAAALASAINHLP